MSLSLRDELRVVLSRDQVQLIRIGRKLTLHGMTFSVLEKSEFPCGVVTGTAWENCIETLESALSGMLWKPVCAKVILSNQFIHYAMVEVGRDLTNGEEVAYARHHFNRLFGEKADSWEIKLNQDFTSATQLGSAVEAQFLNALRDLFARADVKLSSVQPCLMKAFNNCVSQIHEQDVWFVLYDRGTLCLGMVQKGRWNSVRTMKVADDWLDKLPGVIEREAFLSELDVQAHDIYIWSPENWRTNLPQSVSWKMHKLQPVIRPEFANEYEERFAIAMCE